MKTTIAYITHRPNCQFQWFVESLTRQTTAAQRADIQLVAVDGCLWTQSVYVDPIGHQSVLLAAPRHHRLDRRDDFERIVRGRFEFLHVPPKPCAFQGPFRQTTTDYFAAWNTRNTVFIVAKHPYIVCVDDLSVLAPTWFDQVAHAAEGEYLMCGMYKKVLKLAVSPNGEIMDYEEFAAGVDSRWGQGSDNGVVPFHGRQMWGCSFGVPLQAALEVDGFDAAASSGGFEDFDFGWRVERAGWLVFLNRNALTLESEEGHHDGTALPRVRRIVTRANLPKDYDTYKAPNEEEKYWSDHVMLNRLSNETERTLPIIGDELFAKREVFQATGYVSLPEPNATDWRDGQKLSEL